VRHGLHGTTPEAALYGVALSGSLISVGLHFGVPSISPYNDELRDNPFCTRVKLRDVDAAAQKKPVQE
jgi:hypothetical protein